MLRQGLCPEKRVAYFEWDYDIDGGALGANVPLRGDKIPAGAIVTSGIIHVNKAVTSTGITGVAFNLNGAGDVLASTVKGSLTMDAILLTTPIYSAATALLVASEAKGVTMTTITTALTAGKITIALEYLG